jgi:hypothetical protein
LVFIKLDRQHIRKPWSTLGSLILMKKLHGRIVQGATGLTL